LALAVLLGSGTARGQLPPPEPFPLSVKIARAMAPAAPEPFPVPVRITRAKPLAAPEPFPVPVKITRAKPPAPPEPFPVPVKITRAKPPAPPEPFALSVKISRPKLPPPEPFPLPVKISRPKPPPPPEPFPLPVKISRPKLPPPPEPSTVSVTATRPKPPPPPEPSVVTVTATRPKPPPPPEPSVVTVTATRPDSRAGEAEKAIADCDFAKARDLIGRLDEGTNRDALAQTLAKAEAREGEVKALYDGARALYRQGRAHEKAARVEEARVSYNGALEQLQDARELTECEKRKSSLALNIQKVEERLAALRGSGAAAEIVAAIDDCDFEFERGIYEAQRDFLAQMPDLHTDFTVIYSQGRQLTSLVPSSAHIVS